MAPDAKQKQYVQKNYPDSKSDLFAVFIEKCHSLTKKNAYQAMITMHSWMFLSSFEKLRNKLLINNTIVNMAHLGARAFEEIGGEVVQTTSFIFGNTHIRDYQSSYKRLVDYNSQDGKENEYLSEKNLYVSPSENFSKIPGSPIAYWISSKLLSAFQDGRPLSAVASPCVGLQTADNGRFLRLWYEVCNHNIAFHCTSCEDSVHAGVRWFPYNKGGAFRRWYGNRDYVVNWENDGYEIKHFVDDKGKLRSRPQNTSYYFKPSITWSDITISVFSGRYCEGGFLFDVKGSSGFTEEKMRLYILGYLNSKISQAFIKIINPTVTTQVGDMARIPIILNEDKHSEVDKIVVLEVQKAKSDWDSFETSWDFKVHPLVKNDVSTISEAYNLWSKECEDRFKTLKENEEELNRIFIDIYGLQDELDPYVEDKDVTVCKADLVRDIKSFISYAVGCMFGRYSLDTEGLAYAGGEWDSSKYSTFIPDADDIIPVCDEEYFKDDIVSRFVEFVKCAYGEETLEENLQFIANALGGRGASRDVLRNYFLNDFFKDHCNTYQVTGSGKRPIYWQFDSGKKNGFKALVYIHRYTPDLIARMRTGYIHPLQSQYRTQIDMLNNQIDEAALASEKVKLQKQLKKITEQSQELGKYEEKIHHWADKMEPMDLDDGVKANYAKFQDLLTKIK